MGSALFLLVLATNFTGYLLPWDQLAYWDVTIGTAMLAYIPVVGESIQVLLRGGKEVSGATLRIFHTIPSTQRYLHQDQEAETALLQPIEIAPRNMKYLQAIAQFYLARRKLSKARAVAEKMATADPGNPLGSQLIDFIETSE